MYTEYNGKNLSNNNENNNIQENNNQANINNSLYKEPDDKDKKSDKGNRFLGVVWKVSLVAVVFISLFLSLINFGFISLASSAIPNAIVFNQNEIGMKRGTGYQLVTTVLPVNAERL